MSIGTASMYEGLIQQDRPIAWWGLDSADPLVDDSGNGYTLTAGTAAVDAATLISHGDTGLSGSRDFNGSTHSYFTEGSQMAVADGPPAFHASASGTGTTTATATLVTPAEILTGDLMIAVLVHSVNTATMSAAPAGWTQIGSTVNDTQAATAAYRKTAAAADEMQADVTWTWSTTGSLAHAVFVYRGCDPDVANLVFDSSVTALSTSEKVKTSPVETYPEQSRFLVVWTGDATTSLSVTPDPNFVNERVTLQTADNVFLEAVDYVEETAGSRSRHANFSFADQAAVTVVTFGSPQQVVNESLDTLTSPATFHAVVRGDSFATNSRTILMQQDKFELQVTTAGALLFWYHDGTAFRSHTGPTLSTATTYHLVVVDDGTTIHFYRNGVETTVARFNALPYGPSDHRVTVGAFYNGSTFGQFFDGKIDELAVWDIAASDDMVATWYEAYSAGTFGEVHLGGSRPTPRVKLEIAWASAPADGAYVWQDVTAFCQGVATSRGRNFELDRWETGRMDFELSNLNGEFLPDNAASPYYPYVIPTRAVRLRAHSVTDGPIYPLFFGYTEGHPVVRPASGFDSRARFTAADSMKALSLDKVLDQSVRETELAGARIEAVLEGIEGIPFDLDAGQSEVVGDDIRGLNRLDHVQTVASTDGGGVFADASGIVIFQDRHYRVVNEATSRATYDTDAATLRALLLEPEIDEARLFTTAAITGASGVTKTAENTEAVRQHYRRAKEVQTLHVNDNDAQAMAEGYVARYSTPRTIVPEIEIRPVLTAAWTAALSHELSHRITTIDHPLGAADVTRAHFIERIEHSISTGDWRIKVGVSPAELESEYWILDVGELGDTSGRTATVLGW